MCPQSGLLYHQLLLVSVQDIHWHVDDLDLVVWLHTQVCIVLILGYCLDVLQVTRTQEPGAVIEGPSTAEHYMCTVSESLVVC